MITGLFGAIKAAAIGMAHSLASVGRTALEGVGLLGEIGIDVDPYDFDKIFGYYEGLPAMKEEISVLEVDRLIPGKLHMESPVVTKGQFRYVMKSPFKGPESENKHPYITIDSPKRMTPEELIETESATICSEMVLGIGGDLEWEVDEAWVGVL